MIRTPEDPPPSYEATVNSFHVPPRYRAATEGRNSIVYSQLPPLYDTTKIFMIDNKSADINSLNYQNDHSHYQTSIIQNADYSPMEAATQTINFDNRSRWGGEFKSLMQTNFPNITDYLYSSSFRVRVPVSKNDAGDKKYEWVDLKIPEGNYSEMMVMDLMNNAIVEHFLEVGRKNGLREEDIGVKFDTRNFRLGYDPHTGLITPGIYCYEAFHPDIILLPGCGIDFTHSRLNNLLGIRKRLPFQSGFTIMYDDLKGGNIPALLDVDKYRTGVVEPLSSDESNRSYHVGEDQTVAPTFTAYRSWFLAYNYGDPETGIRSRTLLTTPDVTCGAEQLYWSLPDLAREPVTFKASSNPSTFPVVGVELLPLRSRAFYNAQSVYSQLLQDVAIITHVFNRFPDNQILVRPPAPSICSISENVPSLTDHGTIPLKNSISGVQRVTVTDARRRVCPYIYKSLATITPKVLSSQTL
uniref:Penton protein n=1 Tax=Adenovirus squirrel/96-29/KOR TaxID=1715675 RepID=A0A0M4NKE0_9ADEN|nr:penton [Adenovirus squirrel/96-29/KOR]